MSRIEDVERKLENAGAFQERNPEMAMWKHIERLSRDPEALSELSDDEIKCIAAYRALDAMLKAEVTDNKLVFTNTFFNEIIKLRQGLERKGREEIVTILKKRPSYVSTGSDGRIVDEDSPKKGIMEKLWPFGKKK